MINTYQYKSPEGEVVEATPHEYATRLKGMGFVRVVPDTVGSEEIEQRDEGTGKEQQTEVIPENAPQEDEEEVRELTRRRQQRVDDIRG